VFAAAMAGLRATKLVVTGASPHHGIIAAKAGSWWSSGDRLTIHIYPAGDGWTAVTVDVRKIMPTWWRHMAADYPHRFYTVHWAIDHGLRLMPPPLADRPPGDPTPPDSTQ
jgi:hypothetical protein